MRPVSSAGSSAGDELQQANSAQAVGVADVDLQVAGFLSVDWTSGRGEML